MAQNIGSVASNIVDITTVAANNRIETWERTGIDGIGSRDLAKGGGSFFAVCTLIDSSTNINTWKANHEALKDGAFKSGEDSHGTSFSNLMILNVQLIEKKGIIYQGNAKVIGVLRVSGMVGPA